MYFGLGSIIYYGLLVVSAIIPVMILCFYIYKKDTNKEPMKLLMKLFGFGFLGVIPVLIAELLLSGLFPAEGIRSFVLIFINVFLSVALVEEGYKWIIVRFMGFNDKEFDEIYDIIVYSVFVSLGFACVENILFVIGRGFSNAILRALLSIPGHACFAVIMGYFLAKAKVSIINGNKNLSKKNFILSIICPSLAHTFYDAIIMYSSLVESIYGIILFLLFDIVMVITCFITVNKISKIQRTLNNNLNTGVIFPNPNVVGEIQVNQEVRVNYCPVCGRSVNGENYCPNCGCKLR